MTRAGSEQTNPSLVSLSRGFPFSLACRQLWNSPVLLLDIITGLPKFHKACFITSCEAVWAFLDSCTLREFRHRLLNYIIASQLTEISFWWGSAPNLIFGCTALSKRGLGRLKAYLIPLPTTLQFPQCPCCLPPPEADDHHCRFGTKKEIQNHLEKLMSPSEVFTTAVLNRVWEAYGGDGLTDMFWSLLWQ